MKEQKKNQVVEALEHAIYLNLRMKNFLQEKLLIKINMKKQKIIYKKR